MGGGVGIVGSDKVTRGWFAFLLQAVHSNPANWEKPEKYDPTRFDRDYHPYAFLPFINGPRNCLGGWGGLAFSLRFGPFSPLTTVTR